MYNITKNNTANYKNIIIQTSFKQSSKNKKALLI